jgi:hypothetical protein
MRHSQLPHPMPPTRNLKVGNKRFKVQKICSIA